MKWIKMYTDTRTDAKLKSLTSDQFRCWHNLLMFAAEQHLRGTIRGLTLFHVAREVCDGDVKLLVSTCDSLQSLRGIAWRFLDPNDTVTPCHANNGVTGVTGVTSRDRAQHVVEIVFPNFAKRQGIKPSDSPDRTRERAIKSRNKKRSENQSGNSNPVTPPSRPVTPCHAGFSPIELDTDTELKTPLPPTGGLVGASVSPSIPVPTPTTVSPPEIVPRLDEPDEPFVPPVGRDPVIAPPPVANDPAEVSRVASLADRLFPGLDFGLKVRQFSGDVPMAHLAYALDAAFAGEKRHWSYVLAIVRRVATEGLPAQRPPGQRSQSTRKPEPKPAYLERMPSLPPRVLKMPTGPYVPKPPNPLFADTGTGR